ncbi:MAG: hypothetical protein [Cressdnaviricota sp.]|nr:MAG: hypothetical protein [Cressdnaviricota sp.]
MNTFNYGVTIKCIQKGILCTEEQYMTIFTSLINRHKGIYVQHTIEQDSLGRNHLHGHFIARKGIRLNLFKMPYYTIHIVPLPSVQDTEAWTDYINKQPFDIFMQRYYRGEYLFR